MPRPQDGGPAVGEIAIRGPIVMKGYWNRPDATAAVLKDGWLYTGDLGYFDARRQPVYHGTSKELIVLSNGKNIYPEEIEAHYLKSPYIKEICVMGAGGERRAIRSSEHLHAVVVPNFEVLKERKIVNAKEVIRFDIESLSAQLPSTKRIGSYEIWQDDLPRTTTRKLKRFEIEKRVRANQAKGQAADTDVPAEKPLSAEDAAWLEQPEVQQRAERSSARRRANAPEAIGPGDNLELDLGLDSMQRIELLARWNRNWAAMWKNRAWPIFTPCASWWTRCAKAPPAGEASARPQFAGWNAILKEEPTDPEVLALAQPRPIAEAFWFTLSRLLQIFAFDRFQLEVIGLEKLPAAGPFIISSNHQSYLDPLFLAGAAAVAGISQHSLRWAPVKFSARASCAAWRAGCGWWWSIRMRT